MLGLHANGTKKVTAFRVRVHTKPPGAPFSSRSRTLIMYSEKLPQKVIDHSSFFRLSPLSNEVYPT
jgi:hypothetical protein